MPFGISSAPGIFQRVMEGLLADIKGVVVYLDDILITGPTEEQHLATLETVLRKLEDAGLKLRKEKYVFQSPSVVYLGHRIDAQGLHPVEDKIRAIRDAPQPSNITELKAYLGLLSYYSKFLPNLSTEMEPLYRLLKHAQPWTWSTQQQKAFERSKQLLLSSKVLVHFDPRKEIRLACDASPYGIGAVLSHVFSDGSEKPVGFVSRSLTKSERNYAQIEKEALSCVFGVKKFYSYLFGHHFMLQTDHKPLVYLFNESKAVPPQASARLQRWALILASYEYTITGRSTLEHANADAVSRLPLPDVPEETSVPPELVLMVETLNDSPVSPTQIARWTQQDKTLSRALLYTRQGWPDKVDADLKPFWRRRNELSVHEGCLMWSGRVVVPKPGQESVLIELHGGHPGIARMKALSRSFVWWPEIDKDIEDMIKSCEECQQCRPTPAVAPLHPWKWPTRPCLHIDYAGPLDGKMVLVVIDAHSKWIEAFAMTSATATTTIRKLRQIFSQFGIPEVIVSDNGPQFTAEEFKCFCRRNGIHHTPVAPYHPSSNGLAERAVQVVKQGLKKLSTGTMQDRLSRFLFQYRLTPHSTTGISPAEMLVGRRIRSRLDTLRPSLEKRVQEKQLRQKQYHDMHARSREFTPGDDIYLRNRRPGQKWLAGTILKSTGPVSYSVQLKDGRVIRCHQDQLRLRYSNSQDITDQLDELSVPVSDGTEQNVIQPVPTYSTDFTSINPSLST